MFALRPNRRGSSTQARFSPLYSLRHSRGIYLLASSARPLLGSWSVCLDWIINSRMPRSMTLNEFFPPPFPLSLSLFRSLPLRFCRKDWARILRPSWTRNLSPPPPHAHRGALRIVAEPRHALCFSEQRDGEAFPPNGWWATPRIVLVFFRTDINSDLLFPSLSFPWNWSHRP